MALTVEGARLSVLHRQNQNVIGAQVVKELLKVFRFLDASNLDLSADLWLSAALPVVEKGWERSLASSTTFYDRFRAAELKREIERFHVKKPVFSVERARADMFLHGPIRIKQNVAAVKSIDRAMEVARVQQARVGMFHSLTGGRDVLDSYWDVDVELLGYARVTSRLPCYFCAMLASRGPVYSKETGGFKAHYKCGCTAEPVFGVDRYDWPENSLRFKQIWDEATVNSVDPVNDFRRAYNARLAE